MNWLNRLKLWGGVLLVLAVLAALTLLFNQRQNQAQSIDASIDAPTSAVASAFGGVVTDQLVEDGDRVTAGQELFVVSSASLQENLANGGRPGSTVAYEIDAEDGTITYLAASDGYVSDITGFEGTFVGDGSQLAIVVADASKTVKATYRLSPTDYGRIEPGASVSIHLPNNEIISGEVAGVDVTTDAGEAVTKVTVASDDLNDDALGVLTRRGTPVLALMDLRDDGPLAGPTDTVLSFLTKIGLR